MYQKTKLKKYILLISVIGLWIYSLTEPLHTPTAIMLNNEQYIFPKVIAHKALVSDHAPGNSMEAIQEATSTTVDGIEVDVRMSKDGALFLYHGDSLEEYTDHNGIPENYNWPDLAKVRYKNTNEKLVLLADLFHVVGNQKVIFLDIKSTSKINIKIAHKVVDLIKKYKLQNNVFIKSFNPIVLASIRLYNRDIMLMYDFEGNAKGRYEFQEQFHKLSWPLRNYWVQKQIRRIIRPDVLGPSINIKLDTVKKLIDHGYTVITWTVDDAHVAQLLYQVGVQGIQTNKPRVIENIVQRKNVRIVDAGGTNSLVQEIVQILDVNDIQDAIKNAKKDGISISIGGRRHSMGGHSLWSKGLFLDMLNFNKVIYKPASKTIVAQSGATWKKVQEILSEQGRSVKVMQSDNIFTLGGSISANVHGWQVKAPPIASTVVSMTVVTADGKVRTVSPTVNSELFNSIIGGYGLFGVIVDIELETVPNSKVKFHSLFTSSQNFNNEFKKHITQNTNVELAYARLSMGKGHFLDKIGLFFFETIEGKEHKHEIEPVKAIALKRFVFRLSEYFNFGKKLRWYAEKFYSTMYAQQQFDLTRNDAMNSDIHLLWPLYGNNKDVLHEYFIPKNELYNFIKRLKDRTVEYDINMLNATIREVKKDDISLLPYATEDVFGIVCFFSQKRTEKDECKMKQFTRALINDALKSKGTFYLPYRLHYDHQQILAAYPMIKQYISLKKKYDPDFIFQNQFLDYIQKILLQ